MKPSTRRLLPLLCFFCSATQSHAAPKPSAPKPIDAHKTQEMVSRVLRETSELRGLSVKRAVPSQVQSRADVERMLLKQIKTQTPSQQILASELLLRQLQLAPANFDLQSMYVRMMGEQIAGYYDPKTKVFTTTDRVDPLQLETVMAHELTHALQDQHFDLSRLEKWPDHDSDAQLAMSALVEGDATLVMSRYMSKNPLRMLGVLASSFKSQGESPAFSRAPRIVRESVTFPYSQGLIFASNLVKRGGWPAVSAAFTALPQSSEQILHFEKYLSREAPQRVEVRDLKFALGPNWTLLDHDVNGEIGLYLTVAQHLNDDNAAKAAAAGWAGDRYEVFRGPKNAVLVVQDCRFDSEFDAAQWRDAYARSATNRFGAKARSRGALQIWNSAKNGVWMEARGKRVLILEGSVGAFNSARVLSELWR